MFSPARAFNYEHSIFVNKGEREWKRNVRTNSQGRDRCRGSSVTAWAYTIVAPLPRDSLSRNVHSHRRERKMQRAVYTRKCNYSYTPFYSHLHSQKFEAFAKQKKKRCRVLLLLYTSRRVHTTFAAATFLDRAPRSLASSVAIHKDSPAFRARARFTGGHVVTMHACLLCPQIQRALEDSLTRCAACSFFSSFANYVPQAPRTLPRGEACKWHSARERAGKLYALWTRRAAHALTSR